MLVVSKTSRYDKGKEGKIDSKEVGNVLQLNGAVKVTERRNSITP